MSLFADIARACQPVPNFPAGGPVPSLKLYAFCKQGVPRNKWELDMADIETVIATSFDDVFRQRPDLVTWFFVSVTN